MERRHNDIKQKCACSNRAAHHASLDILGSLLAAVAHRGTRSANMRSVNVAQQTSLHVAAASLGLQRLPCVELLLESGALDPTDDSLDGVLGRRDCTGWRPAQELALLCIDRVSFSSSGPLWTGQPPGPRLATLMKRAAELGHVEEAPLPLTWWALTDDVDAVERLLDTGASPALHYEARRETRTWRVFRRLSTFVCPLDNLLRAL